MLDIIFISVLIIAFVAIINMLLVKDKSCGKYKISTKSKIVTTLVVAIVVSITLSLIYGIIYLIDINAQTTDTEIWSGQIISVEHKEEWDEFHPAWDETITKTDSKGKTYTETIHHKAYTEHHKATNYIEMSDQGGEYVYETLDGKKFTDNFVNSNEELEKYYPIGMPTASFHTYENKVQASYSVFKHKEINLDDYKGKLFEYPNETKNYNIVRVLGDFPNFEKVNSEVNKYNTLLNDTNNPNNIEGKKSYKQVNLILINMGNVPIEYAYAQQDYFENGNKNDFIITFGTDSKNNITWCYPFSWSEVERLKIDVRDYILDLEKLDNDFYKKIPDIAKMIEDQYVRKQFADFSYLTVEISKVGKVFMYIFLTIGIVIYSFVYQIVLEERIF